jgi:CubicO group peptidase (beta-lactamase class C family)
MSRLQQSLHLTLFCLLAVSAFAAAPPPHPAVDTLFSAYDRSDSPGCALGVIRDGEFIYRRGYGMANLEYDLPLGPKSVFRIGSTSKQFTAAAIALLAEQGKLSFDDPVRRAASTTAGNSIMPSASASMTSKGSPSSVTAVHLSVTAQRCCASRNSGCRSACCAIAPTLPPRNWLAR